MFEISLMNGELVYQPQPAISWIKLGIDTTLVVNLLCMKHNCINGEPCIITNYARYINSHLGPDKKTNQKYTNRKWLQLDSNNQ